MHFNKRSAVIGLVFFALALLGSMAVAKDPPIDNKAFSTRHIVLQISDASPAVQTRVLNVAGNLIKYYGTDKVDVEVVAFGPGLNLLLANNANAGRVHTLSDSYGVKFDACQNTLDSMTRKLGHTPKLQPDARIVASGAARIIELVHSGYVLIRP